MIRRPPRSTQSRSSAASDVYKRQVVHLPAVADEPDRAGEDLLVAGASSRDLGLLVLQGGKLAGELLLLLAGDVGGYDAVHGLVGPFVAFPVDLVDLRMRIPAHQFSVTGGSTRPLLLPG